MTDFFDHNNAHATPRSDPWFRVYLTDTDGNKAWSRAYFLDELAQ